MVCLLLSCIGIHGHCVSRTASCNTPMHRCIVPVLVDIWVVDVKAEKIEKAQMPVFREITRCTVNSQWKVSCVAGASKSV